MHADPAIRRADVAVSRDALIRRWNALAADPATPDYYELNEFGELILSPKPTTGHQRVASAIARMLTSQCGGEAVTEVSVLTDRGVRIPDVVWMQTDRWTAFKGQTPLELVPDVCVEVLSPSNTREEIEKTLRGGARGGLPSAWCEIEISPQAGAARAPASARAAARAVLTSARPHGRPRGARDSLHCCRADYFRPMQLA
jgi:hypothetical protein